MSLDTQAKSKTLHGITDLTLVAPVKHGLIPALDARSYASRARLLMRTLNTLRISSLEVDATPLIADAAARIRTIHSFRLAILDEQTRPRVLLSVGFDGGWEPYIRRIWRDLGPLLDVIFCNCEDYPVSRDNEFQDYAAWVRRMQTTTEFFYTEGPGTVSDLFYLRDRVDGRCPVAHTAHTVRTAAPHPVAGTTAPPAAPAARPDAAQLWQQAMPALVALYRLTDMYPPDVQPDGMVLWRAARDLLQGCVDVLPQAPAHGTPTEQAALKWFRDEAKAAAENEKAKQLEPPRVWDQSLVQPGIVDSMRDATHGCLALVHLDGPAAAAALIEHVQSQQPAAGTPQADAASQSMQLAFTLEGLQRAGLDEGTLALLPQEFREGMAARAGILGDHHHNHPKHWRVPLRNWPPAAAPGATQRVELSSVHAVVAMQAAATPSMTWNGALHDPQHPLHAALTALHSALGPQGGAVLAVQPMQRFAETASQTPHDHFGFVDGLSQPVLPHRAGTDPPQNTAAADVVAPGDLLLGYRNSLRDEPLRGRMWLGSSFLVVRKLQQDVVALNEALAKAQAEHGLDPDLLKEKMMGRSTKGDPLVDRGPTPPPPTDNRFDFEGDPAGTRCPLHAHIRRANPRTPRKGDMPFIPRILRRGMSYGPRADAATEFAGKEPAEGRGLVFMAYNASIAEQFEVIQGWISGGNSVDGSYSLRADPFLGVAAPGEERRFELVPSEGKPPITLRWSHPFVTLQWGLYAFVPSRKALEDIHEAAAHAACMKDPATGNDRRRHDDQRAARAAGLAARGAAVIARLRSVEQTVGLEAACTQWKLALEDVSARMSGTSQAVWTAVRLLHGGVLRTPYGVLVCRKDLAMEVLANDAVFSVQGYAQRMAHSFGAVYLGMDQSQAYRRIADPVNAVLMKMTRQEAFDAAHGQVRAAVRALMAPPPGQQAPQEVTVDAKDLVDQMLAGLCRQWFGIPDDDKVLAGGWHWNDTPTCPGHFNSPSRYMFQPNPGDETEKVGRKHGQDLKQAVLALVQRQRPPRGKGLAGSMARDLAALPEGDAALLDDGTLATTLIGVMMGFLPTVDGNLRSLLFEWVNDRSLWDHQLAYLRDRAGAEPLDCATARLLPPLAETLQLRPVPELVWRTALSATQVGGMRIEPGDKVVVSLVSVTQQALSEGVPANEQARDQAAPGTPLSPQCKAELALYPIFGGNRRAPKYPTHACPGYEMAMGVMLGFLAGLFDTATLRPTLSPMSLRLSGSATQGSASVATAAAAP